MNFLFRVSSDNPHVDIVGANLYDRYIKQNALNLANGNESDGSTSSNSSSSSLPSSRIIPSGSVLHEQTVEHCYSMLVGTGVYKAGTEMNKKGPDGKVCVTSTVAACGGLFKLPCISSCESVDTATLYDNAAAVDAGPFE